MPKSEAIDRAILSDEAEALQDELKAANIQAAPLCDLIDVREGLEEWRNAVESVLGNAREAMILMEGGRYLDAVRVQRKSSRSAGIQIVKPKVLDDNPLAPEQSERKARADDATRHLETLEALQSEIETYRTTPRGRS